MKTRRDFLKITFATAGGVLIAACGSGANPADMSSPPDCQANGTNPMIAGNHGHVLNVSKADVTAAADKTYDISGTAGHAHNVTVTAADFAKLKLNQSVQVTSTSTNAHTHTVTITCL